MGYLIDGNLSEYKAQQLIQSGLTGAKVPFNTFIIKLYSTIKAFVTIPRSNDGDHSSVASDEDD